MAYDKRAGVAAHARFAGLGIAAALTLAVSAAPGVALAAEGDADPLVAVPATEQVGDPEPQQAAGPAGDAAPQTAPEQIVRGDETVDSVPSVAQHPGSQASQSASTPVASEAAAPTSDQPDGTVSKKADSAEPGGTSTPSSSEGGETRGAEAPSENPSEPVGAAAKATADETSSAAAEGTGNQLTAGAQLDGAAAAQAGENEVERPAETADASTAESSASMAALSAAGTSSHAINVFRMYNPNSGEHFYTSSEDEALHLFNVGWRWESVSYEADSQRGTAVYRLYNPNAGNHFYTTSKAESDRVTAAGWNYEGVAWYAVGNTLLYRLYNPNDGTHVYTASASERDDVRRAGWSYEGTAWSVLNGYLPLANIASHMVYSSAYGGYERYWIASDAQIARNRFVRASENQLGYDVYATASGALARNRHIALSQVVYDAADDGRITIATNLRGIDIASYQAGMNTADVDADFVIVKATQGTNYTNPYMRAQADNAYNSGKLLGFYHYASTNCGGGNPIAEADYFVQQVGSYAGRALLVLDWEGIQNGNFGRNDAWYVKTFLDRVYQRTGVRGVVYMSRSATSSADYSSVANAGYGLWVAQYLYYDGRNQYPGYVTTPMTMHSSTAWSRGMTGAWSSPAIYQYTSEGHVSGYSGELDLNVFYQDSGAWTRMASRA